MPSSPTLFVCRHIEDLKALKTPGIGAGGRSDLASDSIEVQEAARSSGLCGRVRFLEEATSFYQLAPRVLQILTVVNGWLASAGNEETGIPPNLLYWIRHAEGGMTTQRLQDLLLLIQSYHTLMAAEDYGRIVVISSGSSAWEDAVLKATARSLNIPVIVVPHGRLRILQRRVRQALRGPLESAYYALRILAIKTYDAFSRSKHATVPDGVVVELCSSAQKHVIQCIPLLGALAHQGLHPLAVCWNAFRGAIRVRRRGFAAIQLEAWVRLADIVRSFARSLNTYRELDGRWSQLDGHPSLTFQGVPLAPLLRESVRHFFIVEVPQRYRLGAAAHRLFAGGSPAAMKFWTLVFPEATIVYHALPRRPSAVFHWAGPVYPVDNPYDHFEIQPDIVFVESPQQAKNFSSLGIPEDRVVSVGQAVDNLVQEFRRQHTPRQSRDHLGLPCGFSRHIFFDPGYILRGYMAASEQAQLMQCMIHVAAENPQAAILIKPHPFQRGNALKMKVQSSGLANVFVFPRKDLPHHCLNASDLVVTKYSTVGIEAMALDKPVVSVILDGEHRVRVYDDAAEYLFSPDALGTLLNRVCSDETFWSEWSARRIALGKKYLESRRVTPEGDAFQLGARALADHLARGPGSRDRLRTHRP